MTAEAGDATGNIEFGLGSGSQEPHLPADGMESEHAAQALSAIATANEPCEEMISSQGSLINKSNRQYERNGTSTVVVLSRWRKPFSYWAYCLSLAPR